MNYQFGVRATEKHDGEVAEIEAKSLDEAKRKFAEMFPEDVNNIDCITSDNGYEEINSIKKFDVSIHFSRFFEVEAESEQEAIDKANDYAFDEIMDSRMADENFYDDVSVGLTSEGNREYVDYKVIK